MKKESGTVDRRRQVDSPSPQRHLPLVDLLVDTRAELMELAVAPGLKVLHTMFADTDPLNRRVVEQMLVGVATRQYGRSLEPTGAGIRTRGTRKSAVSRRFVATTRGAARCLAIDVARRARSRGVADRRHPDRRIPREGGVVRPNRWHQAKGA
jgi:hypothetical protein